MNSLIVKKLSTLAANMMHSAHCINTLKLATLVNSWLQKCRNLSLSFAHINNNVAT